MRKMYEYERWKTWRKGSIEEMEGRRNGRRRRRRLWCIVCMRSRLSLALPRSLFLSFSISLLLLAMDELRVYVLALK